MEDWRVAQEEAYREQDPELRPLLAQALTAEAARPLLSGLDERVYAAFESAGVDRREAIVTDTRRGGRKWDRLPEGCDITGVSPHGTARAVDVHSGLGLYVDEGIVPLLEACWWQGIETSGSCQGDNREQRAWLHFPTLDDCARFLTLVGAPEARAAMLAAALETMTPGPLSELQIADRFWFYASPRFDEIMVGVSFDPVELPDFAARLLSLAPELPQAAVALER